MGICCVCVKMYVNGYELGVNSDTPPPVTFNKQTTQHSASGQSNNTHTDYVDIVIVRKSLQHLADRGPDQF